MLGVSFFKQDIKGKSFVVAFDTLDEVHEYVPPQFIALAWSARNALLQPLIVLAAESLDGDRRIVTHELTHVISFQAIADQPKWFAEGLATYFETARLHERIGAIDVGEPRARRLRELLDHGIEPASAVFACDELACVTSSFYSTVWALFTFLLEQHPNELARYMTSRASARPGATSTDRAQLWAQAFPSLPVAALDHDLAAWVHHGTTTVRHYKIALRDWPTTERLLTEADAWSANALLRHQCAPKGDAPAEVARALATDSTNVIANVIAASHGKVLAPDLVHAITAAHPDDWRAWWLAWRFATNRDDAHQAHEQTCALLDASTAALPIDDCARDASGAFAVSPRQPVFDAARPELQRCFELSTPAERHDGLVELEVADSGAVTAARTTIGSQASNACGATLKQLVFPPHHANTYHWLMTAPTVRHE